MARKPRVEFAGAFYHVISRGNQCQTIFHSDADRAYYLDRLEHYYPDLYGQPQTKSIQWARDAEGMKRMVVEMEKLKSADVVAASLR